MGTLMMTTILFGLASGFPAAALSEDAIAVSRCEFMQSYGPDTYYENHNDIGSGFVMYTVRSKGGMGIMVADCFSGSTLDIDSSGKTAKSDQRYVVAAAESSEKVTLSDLEKHFAAMGYWTKLEIQTAEHCACAAFYPEAKGKKDDWQVRYRHP